MYEHLVALANGETWAIRLQSFDTFMFEARNGEVSRRVRLPRVEGNVAVIPIHGMITQRGSAWDEVFGGTSTMGFGAAFSRAYNSDRIGVVALDVDSPGGTIHGVQIEADRIFSTRGGMKPVVAVCNSMACSAAYWLGSSAESFVAVPGASSIGNIGVYRMHEDVSGMMEQRGVRVEFISKPEYKVEGNPFQPLSEEGRAFQQQQVDFVYDVFNKTVARNRGVTPAHARDNFGKGRDFHADQAAQMGLIDRVASFEQLFRELGVGTGKATLTQAESQTLTDELCHAWQVGTPEPLKVTLKVRETVDKRRKLLERRMAW